MRNTFMFALGVATFLFGVVTLGLFTPAKKKFSG